MSVLVVGSAALDSIKTPYGEVTDALGGSAIYFAAAASYFTPVRMVAVVGQDFPMGQLEFLSRRGVDTSGLDVARGKTFRWSGIYHQDMNQRDTVLTELNVFENFSPKLPASYKDTPYVFLANIHPALQMEVLDQVSNPRLVMLDTMNLWIDTAMSDLKKVMQRTDVIVLNDQETRQLTSETNLVKAARAVTNMGPKAVIVKKGEHGAFIVSKDKFFAVPAYPLETLFDPTGAGDSFAGGLAGYLAKRGSHSFGNIRRGIAYGSVIASFAVEQFSVERLRTLTMNEIETRLKQFSKMTRF